MTIVAHYMRLLRPLAKTPMMQCESDQKRLVNAVKIIRVAFYGRNLNSVKIEPFDAIVIRVP